MFVSGQSANGQMLDNWFQEVRHSGRIRYEMIDRDEPESLEVDHATRRATYYGRVVEDAHNRHRHLVEGRMRRIAVSKAYHLRSLAPGKAYTHPNHLHLMRRILQRHTLRFMLHFRSQLLGQALTYLYSFHLEPPSVQESVRDDYG